MEAAKLSKFVESLQDLVFQFLTGNLLPLDDTSIDLKAGTVHNTKNES